MEAAIVALISTIGLIIVAKINKAEAKKTRTMIQTNHGKQPWEYLEMVAEVKAHLEEFTHYQHGRNHDAVNAAMAAKAKAEVLGLQLADYVQEDSAAHQRLEGQLHALEKAIRDAA